MNDFERKLDKAIKEEKNLSLVDILSEDQNNEFISSSSIIKILDANNINYLLVGAHAVGRLSIEPRATRDVDIVVDENDIEKAVTIIISSFDGLRRSSNDSYRIVNSCGDSIVDILPTNNPIYKTAMNNKQTIGGVCVPSPEMIMVMKFLSSTSPLRNKRKKLMDKADFIGIMENNDIDVNMILKILKSTIGPEYELCKNNILDWIRGK